MTACLRWDGTGIHTGSCDKAQPVRKGRVIDKSVGDHDFCKCQGGERMKDVKKGGPRRLKGNEWNDEVYRRPGIDRRLEPRPTTSAGAVSSSRKCGELAKAFRFRSPSCEVLVSALCF